MNLTVTLPKGADLREAVLVRFEERFSCGGEYYPITGRRACEYAHV